MIAKAQLQQAQWLRAAKYSRVFVGRSLKAGHARVLHSGVKGN